MNTTVETAKEFLDKAMVTLQPQERHAIALQMVEFANITRNSPPSGGIDGKKLVDWVEEEKMADVDGDGFTTGRYTVYVDELTNKIQSLIPPTEAGTEEVQEVCCKCPYPIWGQDTAMNYYCKNCHLPMASLHPLNHLNP